MAVLDWPTSLPQYLLVEGYSQQLAETTIRTKMDAGPVKVRRRYTAGVEKIEGKILIDSTDLATLRTFYDTTTQKGALRFNWTDPVSGSLVEMRFVSPIKWVGVGTNYHVQLSLEVLP